MRRGHREAKETLTRRTKTSGDSFIFSSVETLLVFLASSSRKTATSLQQTTQEEIRSHARNSANCTVFIDRNKFSHDHFISSTDCTLVTLHGCRGLWIFGAPLFDRNNIYRLQVKMVWLRNSERKQCCCPVLTSSQTVWCLKLSERRTGFFTREVFACERDCENIFSRVLHMFFTFHFH